LFVFAIVVLRRGFCGVKFDGFLMVRVCGSIEDLCYGGILFLPVRVGLALTVFYYG